MSDNFAQPLSKLGDSGIGVAAAPSGGMGMALDKNGQLPDGVARNYIHLPNTAPTIQREIQFGATTVTFSAAAASAFATVTHNMTDAPSSVVACIDATGIANGYCEIQTITSTTFQVRAVDSVARTGTSTVYWIACR